MSKDFAEIAHDVIAGAEFGEDVVGGRIEVTLTEAFHDCCAGDGTRENIREAHVCRDVVRTGLERHLVSHFEGEIDVAFWTISANRVLFDA